MTGRFCRLEPLDPRAHTEQLWAAFSRDVDGRNWTYLFHGPYDAIEAFADWIRTAASSADPMFFTVIDLALGSAVGVASYLRIAPAAGSIEVGHINFSPLLQRTPAATEAMYSMMKHAFELGYRRYEWKCDALNAPSRAAAERLGLTFEGVFRQIREGLSPRAIPVEVPIGQGPAFRGLCNLFSEKAHLYKDGPKGEREIGEIPDEVRAEYDRYRQSLIETVAETDDTLIERYLEGEAFDRDEVLKAMKMGTARLDR